MLTHVGTKTIETNRLLLRRFEYSDNESMRRNWISDKEIQYNYGEPIYATDVEVQQLLEKYITSYEKDDYYRWAVIDKATSECIGQVAYFLVDSKNHFAEIEYCIGREFQGRGLAPEATRAIIQYGFENINLHKVQICCRPLNKKSSRVIEKCGFVFEGELRDYFWMEDHYEGRCFYSILKSEWENTRGGYKFWGWERANAKPVTNEYKGIDNPIDLYNALSHIWCAETCAPRMRDGWTKENMTLGQCSITAFLAQDIFGGDVYGILRSGGNYHCYNVIGDCKFDLTSEQFGDEVLDYTDNPKQLREVHFAKEEKKLRYEYLKAALKNH